jgi:hypothetical protein
MAYCSIVRSENGRDSGMGVRMDAYVCEADEPREEQRNSPVHVWRALACEREAYEPEEEKRRA